MKITERVVGKHKKERKKERKKENCGGGSYRQVITRRE